MYGKVATLKSPKLAFHAAGNLANFAVRRKSTRSTVAVGWEITYRCDCYCSFCNTHVLKEKFKAASADSMMQIAQKLVDAGVKMVTLGGGEPFVVKRLPEVIELLHRHGVRVCLASNGSQLMRYADLITNGSIQLLTVSADDLDASGHDEVRQRDGLFDSIVRGLEEIRRRRHNGVPHLRVRCVITPQNMDRLAEIATFWKQYADDVTFQPLENQGNNSIHQIPNGETAFPPELRPSFDKGIAKLIQTHPVYDTPYYLRMARFIFEPDTSRNCFVCIVPALAIKLRPNGDVIMCSDANRPIGNILRDDPSSIWGSNRLWELRKQSASRTRTCHCWVQPTAVNYSLPGLNRSPAG